MLAAAITAGVLAVSHAAVAATGLPEGFVRLVEIAPDIRQDMRYAGAGNFTGRPVPGYAQPVCILARPAAEALKRVQARLVARGLSLAVLDCYRPRRAVAAFLQWANRPTIHAEASAYLPNIARADVVRLGYIASRSSHSRGIAVDLTIARMAPAQQSPAPAAATRQAPCNSRGAELNPPGALDMGTSFDCFDEMSHTASSRIGDDARGNRALLLAAMTAEGFRNFPREWWHFTIDAPGFEKAHDFVVD